MNDIVEGAKNNPGILAILGLVLASGSVTFYTEGTEEEELQQMAAEFREADVKQNESQHDLDDRYHDLDKRMALMQQQLCLMTQANIPSCD